MSKIGLIVEGHGDRLALPGLLMRVASEVFERYDVQPAVPFRINRGRFSPKFDDYERAVQLLAMQNDAVLVVIDSDDDDPVALKLDLEARATAVAGHRRTLVAPAVREFEAWFLACVDGMQNQGDVLPDATCQDDPDSHAGAKGAFAKRLRSGVYSETVDQKKYCSLMDLALARKNSASFDSFVEAVGEVTGSPEK